MEHRKLVHLVSQSRTLWDRNQRNFRDKAFKMRAWMEIANKMNVSVDICRDTFKALREKYVREREKAQNTLDLSRGWELLEDLKFLDPHILPRNSASKSMEDMTAQFLQDVGEPVDFDKKLIELVRNASPIWDRCSNTYPNKGLKNQLWNSIANALKTDVNSCGLRWKALREKYIRQKGKFQEGEPKWEFLDDMAFLDGVIQYRRKREELSHQQDISEDYNFQDSSHSETFDYRFEAKAYLNESTNELRNMPIKQETPETLQQLPDSSIMGESSIPYHKRARSESVTSEQLSEKKFKSDDKEKSAEQLFGDLVASLLSRKPEKDRNLYMIEIMHVLSK